MGKRLLVIKKLKALMSNGQSGQSDSGVEAEGAYVALATVTLLPWFSYSYFFVLVAAFFTELVMSSCKFVSCKLQICRTRYFVITTFHHQTKLFNLTRQKLCTITFSL